MNIEDLSHETFVEIASLITKRLSFSEFTELSDKISKLYNIPPIDAKGSVFVAFSIKNNCNIKTIEDQKKRRINEVKKLREDIKGDD